MDKKISNIIEALVGVFMTTLFLILFNYFYDDIAFLTSDFDQILSLYNASLVVGIAIQLSRIFIHNKIYKALSDFVTTGFFVVIAYKLWVIYPFDTSVIGDQDLWDKIFKFLIVVPPALAVVGTVANFMVTVISYNKKD